MERQESPRFELTIHLRDSKGNITGKTKTFTSDCAEDLEVYWNNNNTQKKNEQYQSRGNKDKRYNRNPKEGTSNSGKE